MENILDGSGRIKYSIERTGSMTYIHDYNGRIVYTYNKITNTTIDTNGRIVMYGNILLDLARN